MKAYYWLPAGAAGTVEKENGLPVAFTGETNVRGKKRKCFKAFLHPADYSGTRNGRVCVKFEVVPGEAFVTDGALPDGAASGHSLRL